MGSDWRSLSAKGVGSRYDLLSLRVLIFNLASLFACVVAIFEGTATWIVYLITVASVLLTVGTALLLIRHPRAAKAQPDIIGPASLLATVVGVLAILREGR